MSSPLIFRHRRADGRPRIHITASPAQCQWSIGPTGRLTPAQTPGDALNAALNHIGTKEAVIIFEVQS